MGTVSKALSLLTLFSASRPEIGLSDIARLSGLNKATAFRLLSELQINGFVEQVGPQRSYRLGPAVLHLAAQREAAIPLRAVSQIILDRLSQVTGETAHMALLQGGHLTNLTYSYAARHSTQVRMEDTETLSFHATSSGLAILAFGAAEFAETILNQPLTAHTDQTLTDPSQIRAELGHICQDGIAEGIGGFEADVHSHATPVFGPDATPIGTVAVAAPVSRMTRALKTLIRRELRQGAIDLTLQIGGQYPSDFPVAHTP